jgi:hypothetical protein
MDKERQISKDQISQVKRGTKCPFRVYNPSLFFIGWLVQELFADSQIGIADFHSQICRQVVHQAIAQLWVGFA